ncbi:MAG: twin-arginine translocation signal domain-containing protein, partial [Gammaproteobacteria bacterium]
MKMKTANRQSRRRFLRVACAATTALMLDGLPLTVGTANAGKTKIGIVGSGRVGGGIGSVWVKAGYEVMFSSRHIE